MIDVMAKAQQKKEIEYAEQVERESMVKSAAIIEQAIESTKEFVPVQAEEDEPLLKTTVRVRGTKAQLDALKKYIVASGIEILEG